MIEFYIELTDGISNRFRLQSDKKTWKRVKSDELSPDDYISSVSKEFEQLQEINSEINIDGKTWKLNPDESKYGDSDNLYYKIYAKREAFPSLPSKEQLISTISEGSYEIDNYLILNVDGLYELRPVETEHTNYFDPSVIKDPTIAVRHEMILEHHGLIGKTAAKDKELINIIYELSLETWLKHLKTGETNLFADGNASGKNADEIIKQINELKPLF